MVVQLNELSGDFYFWAGLILFVSSLAGILWILKSLRKDSEPEWVGESGSGPDPNRPAQPEWMAEIYDKDPGKALQILSKQLNRIEEILANIDKKLEQPNVSGIQEVSGEMKELIQSLKSNPNAAGTAQIGQLSLKIDKIYQVLASLSGTEEK